MLAEPRNDGTIAARCSMTRACHTSMAVTGAQFIAARAITPGTVVDGLAAVSARGQSPLNIGIKDATGTFEVLVEFRRESDGVQIHSAGVVRSAYLLASGEVLIPTSV